MIPLLFQNQHLLSKGLQPLIVIESILKRSGKIKHGTNYKLLPIGENKSDSSPNWESISISRESSIRTNEPPRKKLDEEVANRVVDVSNLFKTKNRSLPSKRPDSIPKIIRTTKSANRAFSKTMFAPPPPRPLNPNKSHVTSQLFLSRFRNDK